MRTSYVMFTFGNDVCLTAYKQVSHHYEQSERFIISEKFFLKNFQKKCDVLHTKTVYIYTERYKVLRRHRLIYKNRFV